MLKIFIACDASTLFGGDAKSMRKYFIDKSWYQVLFYFVAFIVGLHVNDNESDHLTIYNLLSYFTVYGLTLIRYINWYGTTMWYENPIVIFCALCLLVYRELSSIAY